MPKKQTGFSKWLIQSLILLTFILLDISFFSEFDNFLRSISLLKSAIIFLVVVMNAKTALHWALIGGVILDFLSPTLFGAHLLALIITTMAINILFIRNFTNRSLYTLIILATLWFVIYAAILNGLFITFGTISQKTFPLFVTHDSFKTFVSEIIINLFILISAFLILRRSDKRLRAAFLIR